MLGCVVQNPGFKIAGDVFPVLFIVEVPLLVHVAQAGDLDEDRRDVDSEKDHERSPLDAVVLDFLVPFPAPGKEIALYGNRQVPGLLKPEVVVEPLDHGFEVVQAELRAGVLLFGETGGFHVVGGTEVESLDDVERLLGQVVQVDGDEDVGLLPPASPTLSFSPRVRSSSLVITTR